MDLLEAIRVGNVQAVKEKIKLIGAPCLNMIKGLANEITVKTPNGRN